MTVCDPFITVIIIIRCAFFLTKKWYQKLYQKTNKQNKHKNSLKQGRNEVYGIRDQRPEKDLDQGSQLWDLESQCVGSGSA